VRGGQNLVELLLKDARTNDQVGHLAFFADFPRYELFDVWVVGIEYDHLGRAPRRAARLDSARGAIEHFEERHQAARGAAARQLFTGAANPREVSTRTGAAFEDARLADETVEDAALVNQIVFDRKDVARGNLRMFEGVRGTKHLVRARIDEIVALSGARDAVRPVQPGIEPLRRVRGADLAREHGRHLVVIDERVFLDIEVAVLPAPIGPAAREPVEDLARIAFGLERRVGGGLGAPQPLGNALFGNPGG
jgi:hypothetical protein